MKARQVGPEHLEHDDVQLCGRLGIALLPPGRIQLQTQPIIRWILAGIPSWGYTDKGQIPSKHTDGGSNPSRGTIASSNSQDTVA